MINLEKILFIFFVYLTPLSFILSIILFIISIILKIKKKSYKKVLITGLIFFSFVVLAFIWTIIMGIVGIGPRN